MRARLQLLAKRNRSKASSGRVKKKAAPAMANARRNGSREGVAELLIVSFILVRKTAPMRERTSRVNKPGVGQSCHDERTCVSMARDCMQCTAPAPDSNTVDVAKSRSILSATSRAIMPPPRHSDPVLAYWLSSS